MNNEGTRRFTRRDVLKLAGWTAGMLALTSCGVDTEPSFSKQFRSNILVNTPTPEPLRQTNPTEQFVSPLAWGAVVNRILGNGFSENLSMLVRAIPDKELRVMTAQVITANRLKSRPSAELDLYRELTKAERVIGNTICGDSRFVCKTAFFDSATGQMVAVAEQRTLGAAPTIYGKGVNVSLVMAHCNTVLDPSGCGAIGAAIKMDEGKSRELLAQGISQNTLDVIKQTEVGIDPEIQAVRAAKIQAHLNTIAHGGDPHITVAVKAGLADGSMEVLGAFDESGKAVKIPDVVGDFIAFNKHTPSETQALSLTKGQSPRVYALNATTFNTQDLMGSLAEEKGQTFKLTLQPQTGNKTIPINVNELEQAVASLEYPLAHKEWGKLQLVFGRSPEELALIRDRLMKSEKAWDFMNNKGVIVEALVNEKGEITMLNVLQLDKFKNVKSALQPLTTSNMYQIPISGKVIAEAESLAAQAEPAKASGLNKIVTQLKSMAPLAFKVLRIVQPVFDAAITIDIINAIKKMNRMSSVMDDHSSGQSPKKNGGTTAGDLQNGSGVMTTQEYYSWLKPYPEADPHMISGNYGTTYTKRQLGMEFVGLINNYVAETAGNGDWTNGSKDPNHPYYKTSLSDVEKAGKVFLFDYRNIHDGGKHERFTVPGRPLIFYPQPISTTQSPIHYEYADGEMKQHQFVVLNPNNGEALFTDIPGQMVVPVVNVEPKNPNKMVTYYLLLISDGQGNISVNPVGYDIKDVKTGSLPKSYFASNTPIPVTKDDFIGHAIYEYDNARVS